jgi:hypothetical protein
MLNYYKTIYKHGTVMEMAEYDFEISVEFTNGDNSYWIPTPLEEVEDIGHNGIIDIGDDQSDFEKLVSLVHEIGHVVYDLERKNNSKRIIIFEESLAWYLGYDYALKRGIEIDLQEYAEKIEIALNLYIKEIK